MQNVWPQGRVQGDTINSMQIEHSMPVSNSFVVLACCLLFTDVTILYYLIVLFALFLIKLQTSYVYIYTVYYILYAYVGWNEELHTILYL